MLLRAPSGTGPPTISGEAKVGEELSCSEGDWAPDLLGAFLFRAPRSSFEYQWLMDGGEIGGETAATFTPTEPGSYTCRVTASNQAGSSSQTSADVTVPAPETEIDSGPSGLTNDPTPTFTFSSPDAGSSFRVQGRLEPLYGLRLAEDHLAPCRRLPYLLRAGQGLVRQRRPDPGLSYLHDPDRRGPRLGLDPRSQGRDRGQGQLDDLQSLCLGSAGDRFPGAPYTGSGVHAWGGCTRSGDDTADCDAAGITVIQVSSRDQTDKVVNSTTIQSWLNGRAANDILIGGSNKDTLIGAAGADVMKGMDGNDQLRAGDGTDDSTINCDGGTTPGAADKANLDPLPKDSPASGCETVTRH